MLNAAPQPGSMWHTPWGELIVLGLANEDRPDVAVIAQLANMRVRSIPLAEFVRNTRRTAAYAQNFGLAPILGTLPIAVANVLKERRRQIVECGHTTQIDDHHTDSVLPGAALNYLFAGMMHLQGTADGVDPDKAFGTPTFKHSWPTLADGTPWQWRSDGAERDLLRAAALTIAQLEKMERRRLQVVVSAANEPGEGDGEAS